MIRIRKSAERGFFDHGWLQTHHTFSFGEYHDPENMQFRALRVMNEDRVAPGQGFGTHPHRDMEIVTYVLEGALEHKDSMGNGEVLRPGEFQRMSAGRGITHSEFNPSPTEPVHLYQIWLVPDVKGIEPEYEQKAFPQHERQNRLRLVASRDGRDGSLAIHQDASIFLATISSASLAYSNSAGRHVWLQVLRGAVSFNELALEAGDGAAVDDEQSLVVAAGDEAEIMLFDLA
jgi:redox-sensitive bicupin YhaK (pirin superfamily)